MKTNDFFFHLFNSHTCIESLLEAGHSGGYQRIRINKTRSWPLREELLMDRLSCKPPVLPWKKDSKSSHGLPWLQGHPHLHSMWMCFSRCPSLLAQRYFMVVHSVQTLLWKFSWAIDCSCTHIEWCYFFVGIKKSVSYIYFWCKFWRMAKERTWVFLYTFR